MTRSAPFWLLYAVAAVLFVALWAGGLWPLLIPAFVFGAVPVLDVLLGHDDEPHSPHRWTDDLPLWGWVPVQVGAIAWLVFSADTLGAASLWPAVVGVGILSGAGGITIAHELVHRKAARDRAMAEILMMSVSYTWFCVEHVLGHHRNVATPNDPATSRLGESVYAFLPRTLTGSFRSFWTLEGARCARRGIRPWDLRDRRLRYLALLTATHVAVFAALGPVAWLAFAGQSVIGVSLLEVVNYVEHYGLLRQQREGGEYERVAPRHSWNATFWLSGSFLMNLPRHADHHANAARHYRDLRPMPGAPALPWGYATMLVLAMFPPIWRRVMDARALQARTLSAQA